MHISKTDVGDPWGGWLVVECIGVGVGEGKKKENEAIFARRFALQSLVQNSKAPYCFMLLGANSIFFQTPGSSVNHYCPPKALQIGMGSVSPRADSANSLFF